MKHTTLVLAAVVGLTTRAYSADGPPTFTTSASDFVERAGMCVPTSAPARATVKALQLQLNLVAKAHGLEVTKVSGVIGPRTLKLYGEVKGLFGDALLGDGSSCMGIAPDADVLAVEIAELAISRPITK